MSNGGSKFESVHILLGQFLANRHSPDPQLQHYESPDRENSGIPEELILAHEVTADEHEGVIDTSIEYEY